MPISIKSAYSYIGFFTNNGKCLYGYEQKANTSFIGSFANDSKCGLGIIYKGMHDFYIGQLNNDAYNGKGCILTHNMLYIGNFISDMIEGTGTVINFENKWNIYTGKFKQNKKEGEGKIIYSNGDIYEGIFKEDQYDNNGQYFSAGQAIQITSNFSKNQLSGDTVFECKNDQEIMNAQANGYAINCKVTINNKTYKLECELKNNMLHGNTKLLMSNCIIEGNYAKGKRNGVFKEINEKGNAKVVNYKNDTREDIN